MMMIRSTETFVWKKLVQYSINSRYICGNLKQLMQKGGLAIKSWIMTSFNKVHQQDKAVGMSENNNIALAYKNKHRKIYIKKEATLVAHTRAELLTLDLSLMIT